VCAGAPETHDPPVTRVIVLFEQPSHLSLEEAADWLRPQVARLGAIAGVASVELRAVASASRRWPRMWDWLVEIHLASSADGHRIVEAEPCTELLADLQMLGMRPAVGVVDDGRTAALDEGR
jgi:hypothetical protein